MIFTKRLFNNYSRSELEIILGEKCEARGKVAVATLTSDSHFAAKIGLMQLPDMVIKQPLREPNGV